MQVMAVAEAACAEMLGKLHEALFYPVGAQVMQAERLFQTLLHRAFSVDV